MALESHAAGEAELLAANAELRQRIEDGEAAAATAAATAAAQVSESLSARAVEAMEEAEREREAAAAHGRAAQVDPIKPTLKAPGIELLKLKFDEPLSNFAFKFNLRRYSTERSWPPRWGRRRRGRRRRRRRGRPRACSRRRRRRRRLERSRYN